MTTQGRDAFDFIYVDDVVAGRAVKVRFDWRRDEPSAPTWQQFFSFAGGTSWTHNWTMP